MTLRKPVAVDATGATRKKYDATRVFGRTCGISQREFDGRIARVSNTRLFPSAEVRRVQLANLNDDFRRRGLRTRR